MQKPLCIPKPRASMILAVSRAKALSRNEMSELQDPLRVCREGCLLLAHHRHCPWHGGPVRPLVGLRLGNYRIERPLSTRGGFGVVYFARNVTQQALEAAVKVLKPPFAYRENIVRTFVYEAGLGQGIEVAQVPDIYDVSEAPWPHIKMAYVEGHTLEEELRERQGPGRDAARGGQLPLEEAHGILVGIAKALQASHQVGLIHRDLKPLNILLTRHRGGQSEDRVRVIDWGIAMRILDEARDGSGGDEGLGSDEDSTTAAFVNRVVEGIGSLPYMAPEHFEKRTDKRSDIYQFGIIATEVLTGQFPYRRPPQGGMQAWHNVHWNQRPRPLRQLRKGIPRQLARVVARCLEKDPTRRYPDGGALLEDLTRRTLPLWVRGSIAALLLAVVTLGAYLYLKGEWARLPRILADAKGLETVPYEQDVSRQESTGQEFETPRVYWFPSEESIGELGDVVLAPGNRLSRLTLGYAGGDDETAEPVEGAVVAGEDAAATVTLRFDRIAEFVREAKERGEGRADPGGSTTTRRYAFILAGLVHQGGTEREFRHRVTLAVDPESPRVSDGRLSASWTRETDPDRPNLFDGLDEPETTRVVRLLIPPETRSPEVELSLRVEDENIRSSDDSYRAPEGTSPLGLEVSWIDDDGLEPRTVRLRPSPDEADGGSVYRFTLPQLPEPSPAGGSRTYELTVSDKARNRRSLRLTVILDEGPAVELVAPESPLEKAAGGRAQFELRWGESYDLGSENLRLRLRESGPAARETELTAEVDRPVPGRSPRSIGFRLTDEQLERLRESPEPWELAVDILEPYFEGVTTDASAAEPIRIPVPRDGEVRLEDFASSIELLFQSRESLKKFVLCEYPEFGGRPTYVFATEKRPRAIQLWQPSTSGGRYGIDWENVTWRQSGSAGTPVRDSGVLKVRDPLQDRRQGRRGLQLRFDDSMEAGSSLRVEIDLESYWGREPLVLPLVLIRGDRLPAFFPTTVRIQRQETDQPLIAGSPTQIDGENELRMVIPWSPTYERAEISVSGLSGDEPSVDAIEALREQVVLQEEKVFTHAFLNADRRPLGEGIYGLEFRLEDIFGNQQTHFRTVIHHGQPPRITLDGCQGSECVVEKGEAGQPPEFVMRVRDPSGLARLRLDVDGTEIMDGPVEELLTDEAQARLAGLGVRFPKSHVESIQSHRTALRIVYDSFLVGERKQITLTAWDRDATSRSESRAVTVACTTQSLPAVVPFRGLEWIRVDAGRDEPVFYVCRYELSAGFRANPRCYEGPDAPSPGDRASEHLPLTGVDPATVWSWAVEEGFYLPTLHQWQRIAEGPDARYRSLEGLFEALADPSLSSQLTEVEERTVRDLLSVVYLRETTSATFETFEAARALAPVGLAADGWADVVGSRYPDLFFGALHLIGNAEETVLANRSTLDAPTFLRIGGSRRSRLAECMLSKGSARLGSVGFRLVVYHQSAEDSSGRRWIRNEEFARALQKAQNEG